MTQPVEVSQQSAESRPTKTQMTTPKLLRLAGLSALLAGICYVVVGVFHPANVPSSVATTRWQIVHVFACAMCFFGVLGMAGLYARQAKKVGWLGLVGYVLFSLWLVLIMGFSFVEAFILPRLATTDPNFVEAWMGTLVGPASKVYLGALPALWTLSAPIYILGGVLFGIATFRAGILPRWAGALLALGTVLAEGPRREYERQRGDCQQFVFATSDLVSGGRLVPAHLVSPNPRSLRTGKTSKLHRQRWPWHRANLPLNRAGSGAHPGDG